ncbi:malonyl-CoA/methylmalonyl-CoA synthetase [Aminobacter niigataensis]|uniref:Malonyl-CoA/methylmalonyl-CoA synthetase n=1 Tax=Aminobacter niigataensis TaxID=83265 RepID=A0ABR6L5K3_9HYPH|nr:malonyl-CoA/methylmalonyl-CoA synthetase [Aminobacter niigataensis]
MEKSPEVIALFLACARAGAIFLPLNTAYTLAEIEYFVDDAEPKLIVVAPQRISQLVDLAVHKGAMLLSLGVAGDGTLMEAANQQNGAFRDVSLGWDDLVAILYTSGTTGRSKGAMLTHGNLASNALALVETWHFTEADTLLHALPVYHTHGLFTATNTLLLSGGTMLFRPKFDAEEALRLMPQATTMMGVPTFYTRLLQHPGLTRKATTHMRLFISGSAPLLAETHAEFAARTGHAILERYGMTETNMNSSNPYDGPRIAGTVGKPLPDVDIRITDPANSSPLPVGEIGMIEIRGPNVFKGYWRMPEKTAEEMRADGFFITGDLGRIDDNGYVSIVGRGKDLIITGGFNVYPKEIETEIDLIEGVVESAVIGIPHRDFGEGVTAIVVASNGTPPTEAAILAHLQSRLAKFKLPKRVLFVDDLPRNAMGKVQKALMRQTYSDLYGN